MAITFVQTRNATNQGGPTSLAFTNPLTSGNTAFVALGYTDNGVLATSVIDNAGGSGNTYALLKRFRGNGHGVDLWIAKGIAPGAATVTVTWSAGKSGIGICLLEYATTVGQVFALDQQNGTSTATHVTAFPSGSITTLFAAELILYVGQIQNLVTTAAGYTPRSNPAVSGSVTVLDRITAATETTNPTPTDVNPTAYAAMVVSLNEVADSSGLRLTQQGRQTLTVETTVGVRLTQMARQVLYPFTCVPTPIATGVSGCPETLPLTPVTGAAGCPPELQ